MYWSVAQALMWDFIFHSWSPLMSHLVGSMRKDPSGVSRTSTDLWETGCLVSARRLQEQVWTIHFPGCRASLSSAWLPLTGAHCETSAGKSVCPSQISHLLLLTAAEHLEDQVGHFLCFFSLFLLPHVVRSSYLRCAQRYMLCFKCAD